MRLQKSISANRTKSKSTDSVPTSDVIESLVSDAISTPSGDNCQPWKFRWDGKNLFIFHVETLAKHSMNPSGHASMMALGTVVEAIALSATRFGFSIRTHLSLQNTGALPLWATVTFEQLGLQINPLTTQIAQRTTDRRFYNGGQISESLMSEIKKLEDNFPGCYIRFQDQQTKRFMNYLIQTESLLWRNSKIVKDLTQWMRLSQKEINNTDDGMSWKNLNITALEASVFKLIRLFPVIPRLLWFLGFGRQIKKIAKESVESSAALVCFSAENSDLESFFHIGRISFKTWLLLNANGFGVQPMSYCSTSIANIELSLLNGELSKDAYQTFFEGKSIVQENFNMNENEIPVWMFRTGVSESLPLDQRTSRRIVSSFLI